MSRLLNKQVYEEAAEWLVELRVGDVDAATRERLDVWFRESPNHIRAFLELSSIWEDGSDKDLDRAHSTEDLIARARGVANITPLERMAWPNKSNKSADVRGVRQRPRRRHRRSLLAASIAAVCLAGGLGLWLLENQNPNYATQTGEERSILLPDGSHIELNSKSRVRVRFSSSEREIDLLEGQALFKVAKDASRPFLVHSDAVRVRAVGTQFDVYKKVSGTTVTVLEGRVAVLSAQQVPAHTVPLATQASAEVLSTAEANAILVVAGEQLTMAPKAAGKPTKADVTTITAWTQHQLVFDSTPLAEVVQEFNRYNVRQLVVADRTLDSFHVTGVFSSTDPASLLRFLRSQRDLDVVETGDEIRISKK